MNKYEMKKVNERISVFKGQKLKSVTRAASMLCLGFGELVKSKEFNRDENGKVIISDSMTPKYVLNIESSFRISQNGTIMISKYDMFIPKEELRDKYENGFEEFNWDIYGENAFDEKIKKYFVEEKTEITIKDIQVNMFGDLTVLLSNGYLLEVFIDSSDDEECWRFFESGNYDLPHLVICGNRVSED